MIDHLCLTPGKQQISPAQLQDACANKHKQKINTGMPNLSYHENHFETELHDNLIKQIVLFQAQFAMNADYFQEQSVTCTAYVMNSPLFTSFPALFMWRKHSIYFPQQVHLKPDVHIPIGILYRLIISVISPNPHSIHNCSWQKFFFFTIRHQNNDMKNQARLSCFLLIYRPKSNNITAHSYNIKNSISNQDPC